MNKLSLVPNENKYWEFIGKLRSDERIQNGFVEQITSISSEQQNEYMKKYGHCYMVCTDLLGGIDWELPIGFVGIVDNDIRIAVIPEYHNQGVGKFMLNEIAKNFTELIYEATAKVKHDNSASHKLFLSCRYQIVSEDKIFKYYKIGGPNLDDDDGHFLV